MAAFYVPSTYFRLALAIVLMTATTTITASAATAPHTDNDIKPVLGWVEFVTLQPAGAVAKAKLDTGAKTSSLQASNIRYFERDGQRWVHFSFDKRRIAALGGAPAVPKQHFEMDAPLVRMVKIKQHTVDFVDRPCIEMDFELAGKRYRSEFTLTDRSDFLYPVLLGRRFLEASVLVDASRRYISGTPPILRDSAAVETPKEKQTLRKHAGQQPQDTGAMP